jgi:hypothetical protein
MVFVLAIWRMPARPSGHDDRNVGLSSGKRSPFEQRDARVACARPQRGLDHGGTTHCVGAEATSTPTTSTSQGGTTSVSHAGTAVLRSRAVSCPIRAQVLPAKPLLSQTAHEDGLVSCLRRPAADGISVVAVYQCFVLVTARASADPLRRDHGALQ